MVADGFRRIRDRAQANLLCHGRLRRVMRFDHALLYCVALAAGSVVGAVILSLLKKNRTDAA